MVVYELGEPDDHGLLDVGDGQAIYWETVGTPHGTPAVFLHGGPGSGTSSVVRGYFDPVAYRGVLFDQRGCGRSAPLADSPSVDLSTNTTAYLVADIERLREHLGIDRWVVVGVSWGSALALAYSQRHPDRVRGVVVGAVTAGTRRETDWITRDMGRLFPSQWADFIGPVPPDERNGDIAAAYARLLTNADPAIREEAARRWCTWEDTHVSLRPGWEHDTRYDDPQFRSVFARLVTHYWSNGCFLAEDEVLEGMPHLANTPGVLVHGRHDISGPLETAWRLHERWPASELVIVEDAGHGGRGFGAALTRAIDQMHVLP